VVANVSISRDGKKNHDCYWLTFPKWSRYVGSRYLVSCGQFFPAWL
jgi:hypothetical protein